MRKGIFIHTAFYLGILFLEIQIKLVYSHGRLVKPPARSSVWRTLEFRNQNPPRNYNDHSLFCGNIFQVSNPGRNCGVCGDPITEPPPRDNEIGGKYYKGIITGRYRTGQIIEVEVNITSAHKGFMEWRLCTNPRTETQDCFNRFVLQREDGRGTKVPVKQYGLYKSKLRLPSGVTCSHCIIQWNYRAGNFWGSCGAEKRGSALGCGAQQNFRGCADVSIT